MPYDSLRMPALAKANSILSITISRPFWRTIFTGPSSGQRSSSWKPLLVSAAAEELARVDLGVDLLVSEARVRREAQGNVDGAEHVITQAEVTAVQALVGLDVLGAAVRRGDEILAAAEHAAIAAFDFQRGER